VSEEQTRRIIIESTIKNYKRTYLNFKYFSGDYIMGNLETLSVLQAALSMAVKITIKDMDYESQGRLLSDIIGNIESEFSNPDSFKDLKKYNGVQK
jgi:hypothetical protein